MRRLRRCRVATPLVPRAVVDAESFETGALECEKRERRRDSATAIENDVVRRLEADDTRTPQHLVRRLEPLRRSVEQRRRRQTPRPWDVGACAVPRFIHPAVDEKDVGVCKRGENVHLGGSNRSIRARTEPRIARASGSRRSYPGLNGATSAEPGGKTPMQDSHSTMAVAPQTPGESGSREDDVVVVRHDELIVAHPDATHGLLEDVRRRELTRDRVVRVGDVIKPVDVLRTGNVPALVRSSAPPRIGQRQPRVDDDWTVYGPPRAVSRVEQLLEVVDRDERIHARTAAAQWLPRVPSVKLA
jgi:hypothetical protein